MASQTLDELYNDLEEADQLGENDIAGVIAGKIKALQAPVAKPADTRSFGRKAADYVKSYGTGLNEAAKSLNKASLDSTPELVGAADAGASVVSSALAPFAAGIDKTLGAVFPGTRDAGNPENDYDKLKAKYQYEPRTDTGKAITGGLGALFAPVADLTNVASDKLVDAAQFEYKYPDGTRKAGISPETADQAREMLPDALGLAAGGRTKPGRAVLKAPAKTAEAVSAALDTKLRYDGNAAKLHELEFDEVGGKKIELTDSPRKPFDEQRAQIGKFVSDNQINEVKPRGTETPIDAKLRVTRAIQQKAGRSLGQNDARIDAVMQNAGLGKILVPTRAITDEIRKNEQFRSLNEFDDAASSAALTRYNTVLAELGFTKSIRAAKDTRKAISYDQLARLKNVVKEGIDWKNGDSAANTAGKHIWHILDDAQDALLAQADAIAKKAGGKGLIDQVRIDKQNYRLATEVEEGLVKQSNQGLGDKAADYYYRYSSAKTKTGKVAKAVGGTAAAYGLMHTPYFVGAVPAAAAAGRAGDQFAMARLRSKVRNSQHYTQGP